MSIIEIQRKFFKKYPNIYANITYNERLERYVCYSFDIATATTHSDAISEDVKRAIRNFKSGDTNAFNTLLAYFTAHGIDEDLLSKIGDYYYECLLSEKTFANTDEVCDAINAYLSKTTSTENTSNHSMVTAHFINEDGEIEEQIFYMEVIFQKKTGKAGAFCKIENTFTKDKYYGNGLHSYGIKFLEAVCAEKGVFTLFGESVDCDLHETKTGSSLNEHYRNMGFTTTTDSLGNTYIAKAIDGYSSMKITPPDDHIR